MKQLLQADQLVSMLAEVTGRKFSPEGLMAYDIALSDVPLAALNSAALQLLKTAKFMPSPAEIREAAGAVSGAVATKDKPTLAWVDVRRAINRVGGYDSPNFQDPLINATIRAMGGWVALCDSTPDELVWREKDFLRTYAALAPLPLPAEQTERLFGITEKENGSALPSPIVDVGCLTAGGAGVVRRVEEPEMARIAGPSPAAELLAKRLEFDDRPELKNEPTRSKDEQLEILRAMTTYNRG